MLINKGKGFPRYGDDEPLSIAGTNFLNLSNRRLKTHGADLRAKTEREKEIEKKAEGSAMEEMNSYSLGRQKRIYSEDVDETLYLQLTADPKIRRPHLRVLLKNICKILGKPKVSNEDEVLEAVEMRKKLQEKLRAAAVEKEKQGGRKGQRVKPEKEKEGRIKKE